MKKKIMLALALTCITVICLCGFNLAHRDKTSIDSHEMKKQCSVLLPCGPKTALLTSYHKSDTIRPKMIELMAYSSPYRSNYKSTSTRHDPIMSILAVAFFSFIGWVVRSVSGRKKKTQEDSKKECTDIYKNCTEMYICKFCGKTFDKFSAVCPNCGGKGGIKIKGAPPQGIAKDMNNNLRSKSEIISSKPVIKITCIKGPIVETSCLGETICIGRSASACQFVFPINTPGVSEIHCIVRRDKAGVEIRDLNSKYGTYLADGTRLQPDVPFFTEEKRLVYIGSKDVAISVELINSF